MNILFLMHERVFLSQAFAITLISVLEATKRGGTDDRGANFRGRIRLGERCHDGKGMSNGRELHTNAAVKRRRQTSVVGLGDVQGFRSFHDPL